MWRNFLAMWMVERHLQKMRRQAKKDGDNEAYQALDTVLDDKDMLEAVKASIVYRYYGDKGEENPLTDLLQWLIDNWEVILEIVLTIIAIFVAQRAGG